MEKFLMSTDNNRDEYAELLKYEIEMFYITVKKLEKKEPRKEEERIKRAVFFEAFLLHTRILVDFFLHKAIEEQQKKKNSNDSIKLIDILSIEDAKKLEQTTEYDDLKNLFLVKEKGNMA